MRNRLPFLLISILLAFLAGRFIIRDFLAGSLIEYGEDQASRDQAVVYAPGSPEVVAARGKYLFYRAEPPQPEAGLVALRQAVLLSPHDYRFWLELGKAYENAGQSAAADRALERAVSLAPRYFETQWTWANYQMRAGQTDRALESFHRALLLSEGQEGKTNGRAALNVYDVVAQALGLNLAALRQVAPEDATAQAYLAYYLATHQALDPALEIFRKLPAENVPAYLDLIYQLLADSQRTGRYAEAGEAWDRLRRLSGEAAPEAGNMIENGGFERAPLSDRYPQLLASSLGFDWLVQRHPEVAVRRDDDRPHGGNRSLHLHFSMRMQSPFEQVSQLARVEPGASYRLRFFVRARNLPEDAPWIEIRDAQRPEAFSLRATLPRDAAEWREVSLGFSTLPETRAISIVLRAPQYRDLNALNKIDLWLDDFEAQRSTADATK